MRWMKVCAACAVMVCATASADSLFSRQAAERGTFISDNKVRFAVGDMITVLVREDIDARMDSQLDTERKSQVDMSADPGANRSLTGNSALIELPQGILPNVDIESDNKHESDGTTRRRNQVVFTVTCQVMRVLPNGNIELTGEKRVTVNRDDSLIRLSGVARTRDVSAENTLDSNLLANAIVELKGKGPMWNNQRRGWFTRLFDWFQPY